MIIMYAFEYAVVVLIVYKLVKLSHVVKILHWNCIYQSHAQKLSSIKILL